MRKKTGRLKEKLGPVKKLAVAVNKLFGTGGKAPSAGKKLAPAQLSPRAQSTSTKRYNALQAASSPGLPSVIASSDFVPTFLNTYNSIGVTVDPPASAPDVDLWLSDTNTLGLFSDPNWDWTFDITSGQQYVPVYGFNLYRSPSGTLGSTPLNWLWDPTNDTQYPLTDNSGNQTNLNTYLLSGLIQKPVKDDLDPLQKAISSQLNSQLKGQIQGWYTSLLQTYPVGSDQYKQASDYKDYCELGTGWADLQKGCNDLGVTLGGFLGDSYNRSNVRDLDTTDLTGHGPARGIHPSDLGGPSFNINPVFRPGSLSDYYNTFKAINGDHSLQQNTNYLVKAMGFEAKYKPNNDISLSFGATLQNPLKFSLNKFQFDTSQIQVDWFNFGINNLPIWGGGSFGLGVTQTIETDNGHFDRPAITAHLTLHF